VNTKKLKKIVLNRGGMTNVPSCPMIKATMRVHAVAPSEKPLIFTRPSTVPSATAKRRNTSGAVAAIHLTVFIVANPAKNM
jgi:hypothetical protein